MAMCTVLSGQATHIQGHNPHAQGFLLLCACSVQQVVGTRGDVQPFVGIGLKLLEYGHRVRIASHLVSPEGWGHVTMTSHPCRPWRSFRATPSQCCFRSPPTGCALPGTSSESQQQCLRISKQQAAGWCKDIPVQLQALSGLYPRRQHML